METLEKTEHCFPQLLNTSCRKPRRQHNEAVLINVVLSIVSLATATLNLLVIISISHFKQLHSPTNFLLLSLAVSDFLLGVLMAFPILQTDGCWFLGDLMCVLYNIFSFIITSASVGTMVLISVDRYVAICHPLHYSTKVTVRGITNCICLCWAFSFIYNGLILKDNLKHPGRFNSCFGQCVIVLDYFAGIADLIFTFIGPVTVIIVLYMRVFVVAVSQARAMRSHITAVTLHCSYRGLVRKSEVKAAKTLGVVVLVFLMCLCPYYGSTLAAQNTPLDVTSVPIESWLFFLNSCLNPLIYAFCYSWFLKSVKLIVTFKIFEPNSCDASMI